MGDIKKLICISLITSSLVVTFDAIARPDFLQAWERIYPESVSNRRQCQLCHYRKEGGDGWNRYGISIRRAFLDIYRGFDIESAIIEVEQGNADLDTKELSNLEEIEQGLDPGWVIGNNNDIVFNNFQMLLNQPPPFSDVDQQMLVVEERICFPIVTKTTKAVLLCL